MTKAELDVLEQDVAAARRRLAGDLAALRSPSVKNDLWARAQETKDELIQKATAAANTGTQRVMSDLKAKARANPLATLAIGAGVAWHVARHPPISTLLVGVGIASLLRTPRPPDGSPDFVSQASELAGTVGHKVQRWSEEAREVTQQKVSQLTGTASNVATQAKDLAGRIVDEDLRDAYLLSAAALAIGAATVISYQRRGREGAISSSR
jgi:hypothetical protein